MEMNFLDSCAITIQVKNVWDIYPEKLRDNMTKRMNSRYIPLKMQVDTISVIFIMTKCETIYSEYTVSSNFALNLYFRACKYLKKL